MTTALEPAAVLDDPKWTFYFNPPTKYVTAPLVPDLPVEPTISRRERADIYRNAAQVIEEQGWVQNRPVDSHGGRCAGEAIRWAWAVGQTSAPYLSDFLYESFARWLVEHKEALIHVSPLGAIQNWNDQKDRTKDEVVSALREFADSIRA